MLYNEWPLAGSGWAKPIAICILPEDEQQAFSKHVEAYYWNKLIENTASCWFMLYGCVLMHGQQNIKFTYRRSLTHRQDYSRLTRKILSFCMCNIISSVDSIGESRIFVPRMPNVKSTSRKNVALNPEECFLACLLPASQKYTNTSYSIKN